MRGRGPASQGRRERDEGSAQTCVTRRRATEDTARRPHAASAEVLEEAIEELALRREELAARRLQLEPVGAVDLGELDLAAALRLPLHLECVAVERLRVEVALGGPGVDDFAGPLADRAEVDQLARVEVRRAFAELLVE